ncbi:MAG: hypothetical protein ABH839_03935 [Chloroflexota bacterium]
MLLPEVMKRILLISVLVFVVLLVGCSQPTTAPNTEKAPIPSTGRSVIATFELAKAPRVGEAVDLTYTWEVTSSHIQPVTKIWIEFRRYDPALWYPLWKGDCEKDAFERLSEKPDSNEPRDVYLREMAPLQPESFVPQEAVVVSGNLNWEGPPLRDGDIVRLNATLSFPEEGEWLLYVFWATEEVPRQRYDDMKLTVTKEFGMFGWPKDYSSGHAGWQPPNEVKPYSVTLKPSRAPLVGETFKLTMTLKSIKDLDQAEAGIELVGMGIPLEEVLVEGSFTWNGSLKKDDPIVLTGTLIFPKAGKYKIRGYARALPDGLYGYSDSVFLHVGKEESWFGWTDVYRKPHEPEWPFSCAGP